MAKPMYKTARPYTEPTWPEITSVQRDDILNLLCNLLQPLGDHRKAYIQPSRGKGQGKKRKRSREQSDKKSTNISKPPDNSSIEDAIPPPPEIGNHILIGLNAVTRYLEALAAQNAPPTAPARPSVPRNGEHCPDSTVKGALPEGDEEDQKKHDEESSSQQLRPLSLVAISHNHPRASLPHAHLPTLIHLSVLSSAISEKTRLVALPPSCESRFSSSLHIPHVGALGILEGAPGADTLVAYAREQIGTTRCAWIDEAMRPEWKGVKIDVQTGCDAPKSV